MRSLVDVLYMCTSQGDASCPSARIDGYNEINSPGFRASDEQILRPIHLRLCVYVYEKGQTV